MPQRAQLMKIKRVTFFLLFTFHFTHFFDAITMLCGHLSPIMLLVISPTNCDFITVIDVSTVDLKTISVIGFEVSQGAISET